MNRNLLYTFLWVSFFTFFLAEKGHSIMPLREKMNNGKTDSVSLSYFLYSVTENSSESGQFVTKYYPNPATNYITFELSKKVETNSRLLIYSFTGRKMTDMQIANLKATVNLSDYLRGLYLFQLVSPKGIVEESGKFQVLK